MFNSEAFKAARFRKVKSPVELVVSAVKLAGSHSFPEPGLLNLAVATSGHGPGADESADRGRLAYRQGMD